MSLSEDIKTVIVTVNDEEFRMEGIVPSETDDYRQMEETVIENINVHNECQAVTECNDGQKQDSDCSLPSYDAEDSSRSVEVLSERTRQQTEMVVQDMETNSYEPDEGNKVTEGEEQSYFIQVDASTVVNLKAGTQYTLVPMNTSAGGDVDGQECICLIENSVEERKMLDNVPTSLNFVTEDQNKKDSSVEVSTQPTSSKDHTWLDYNLPQDGLSFSPAASQMPSEGAQMAPTYAQLKPVSPLPQVSSSWSLDPTSNTGTPLFQPPTAGATPTTQPLLYPQGQCGHNCHHSRAAHWNNPNWAHYDQNQGYPAPNPQGNQTELERPATYQRSANNMVNGNSMSSYMDNMQCYVPYNGRENHNEKERKRRTRIKMSCQNLRTLVPGLNEKTDKATVFELTVQYLAYLKRSVAGNVDKDFLDKYSVY